MGFLRHWFSSSSPTVKMLMAISITSLLFVGHKMYYAPYMKKQRYYNNEAWAKMIIENEESSQESLENNN